MIGRRRQLIEDSLAGLDADPATVAGLAEVADRLARLL